MAPGILAQLCMLILFILYWTEWFPIDVPRQRGFVLAGGALGLTACSPLKFTATWWVHPGLIALCLGLWIVLRRMLFARAVMMLSYGLFAGTALFLWHEFARINTDWSHSLFRLLCVAVFSGMGLCLSQRISEQVAFILFGSLLMHGLIITFHREMLMPIVWGPDEFLDTVWLSLAVMLGLHRLKASAVVWFKPILYSLGYKPMERKE